MRYAPYNYLGVDMFVAVIASMLIALAALRILYGAWTYRRGTVSHKAVIHHTWVADVTFVLLAVNVLLATFRGHDAWRAMVLLFLFVVCLVLFCTSAYAAKVKSRLSVKHETPAEIDNDRECALHVVHVTVVGAAILIVLNLAAVFFAHAAASVAVPIAGACLVAVLVSGVVHTNWLHKLQLLELSLHVRDAEATLQRLHEEGDTSKLHDA